MGATARMGASRAEVGASQTNSIQHGHETDPEGTPEVIKLPTKGLDEGSKQQGESEESYLVDWDGPNDPANPLNWSLKLKGTNCVIISFYTFITYETMTSYRPSSDLIKPTAHWHPRCLHQASRR
jgi:hypothetical protein